MADESRHIDILIATCRRPQMLQALLESIAAVRRPPGHVVRIVVVDNDPSGSARHAVEAFASASALATQYAVEPLPGVSHVRNRALALAQGEAVAFVDDDERVAPEWLCALVDTARRHEADVVFGPVLSVLPPGTPAWISRSGLFDRPRMPTGTPRQTGGAGNVLISRSVLARTQQIFDPAFGLSGAEDTHFFNALHRTGARLVWCDEAVAWETVTPDRASLRWLWHRNFANGRLYGRIYLPTLPAGARLSSVAKSFFGLAAMAVAAPLGLLAGRHVAARALMALARFLGRLVSISDCLRAAKAAV